MTTFKRNEILILSMAMSACSILYELLLANTLSVLTGSQVLWQSLVIAFYVGGLGLGAFISDKIQKALKSLLQVEFTISILGAISVLFIYLVHGGHNFSKYLFFIASGYDGKFVAETMVVFDIAFFVLVLSMTLAIGFLTGLELPLIFKLKEDFNVTNVSEGEILGANYLGTLVGTIGFTFYLKPQFDLLNSAVITALVNIGILLFLVFKSKLSKEIIIGVVITFIGICFLFQFNHFILKYYLKAFYYLPRFTFQERVLKEDLIDRINTSPDIERHKSMYQYIDFVFYKRQPQNVGEIVMNLDQHFQFSSFTEKYYHEGFAHVGILINERVPKKILVLGAGDGFLIRELNKYPEIESITNVELDPAVIDVAINDKRVSSLNRNSYSDKRVHVITTDAFYYVRNTKEKFDAIYIDFPYPNNYDLARLYSLEIYRFINRILEDDGFIVLDAPLVEEGRGHLGEVVFDIPFTDENFKNNSALLSTLYFAGFESFFPYQIRGESFILAKKSNLNLEKEFSFGFNKDKYHEEVFQEVQHLKKQSYPHKIEKKFINSVFRPTLGFRKL